jgi:HSP20 family protein
MKPLSSADTGQNAIYPGAFRPHEKIQSLQEELTHEREGGSLQPLVNIRELKDCFVVEMAIPGVEREDFDVSVNNNMLSVAVLHKTCETGEASGFRLHEFNYECFRRQVELPSRADTEFMMAEYRIGILYIYFQKSDAANPQNTRGPVVVY